MPAGKIYTAGYPKTRSIIVKIIGSDAKICILQIVSAGPDLLKWNSLKATAIHNGGVKDTNSAVTTENIFQ